MQRKDLTGQKFGMLTVIKFVYSKLETRRSRTYYECKCDCGNVVIRQRDTLVNSRRAKVHSCGCLKIENIRKIGLMSKHGLEKTRFYQIYRGMINRTTNPKHKNYKSYGERGIKVCDRWQNFLNFRDDMYESYIAHVDKYGEHETTIERVNVNGNYSPDNCKWATWEEQYANRTIGSQKKFKATNIKTGEVYYETSQLRFAKNHNISNSHIGDVLNNKRQKAHGFYFEYV